MNEHAKQRAFERYNQEYTILDFNAIKDMIIKGHSYPIENLSTSKKRKFHYVVYKHVPLKVLYANSYSGSSVITLYPIDVDEFNEAVENKKQKEIKRAIRLLSQNGYLIEYPN